MGINVRMQNAPKPDGIIAAQVNLEKDLKDCMRCKFFYGNNSQCLARKCVFRVTAGADIYKADGTKVYSKGDVIAENLVAGSDGQVVLTDLHLGT